MTVIHNDGEYILQKWFDFTLKWIDVTEPFHSLCCADRTSCKHSLCFHSIWLGEKLWDCKSASCRQLWVTIHFFVSMLYTVRCTVCTLMIMYTTAHVLFAVKMDFARPVCTVYYDLFMLMPILFYVATFNLHFNLSSVAQTMPPTGRCVL